jgi:hypothetical protein
MKCKICPKETSKPCGTYCCHAHYTLDKLRYVGESVADAIKRRGDKRNHKIKIYKNR